MRNAINIRMHVESRGIPGQLPWSNDVYIQVKYNPDRDGEKETFTQQLYKFMQDYFDGARVMLDVTHNPGGRNG